MGRVTDMQGSNYLGLTLGHGGVIVMGVVAREARDRWIPGVVVGWVLFIILNGIEFTSPFLKTVGCLCVSVCVCVCHNPFLCVSVCVCLYVYVCECLNVSVYLRLYEVVSVCAYAFV